MKKLTLIFSLVLAVGYVSAQHTISMTLVTDRYASETTYELVNTLTDEVLASGGPWANLAATGTTVRTINPVEVDGTGCYAFYVYDSYGDGICCAYGAGYFEVTYDAVLVGEGSNFGDVGSVTGMGTGCPENEIELAEITTIQYTAPSQNLNITGKVLNNGTLNLTSFDVTYSVDGGTNVATYTATCNVTTGSMATFTHNIPVNFATDGIYSVEVFVSNPNTIADDDSDNSLVHAIAVNSVSTPRKVFMEHFSTQSCPNCPAATANLMTWTSTRPNIIWATHHDGYYTDDYTIPEDTDLCEFFNDGGSTYAPAIMLDRVFLSPDGDPGPVFFPDASYTTDLMDERLDAPAYVTMNMTGLYNPDTRDLDLTISGEFVGNVIGDNIKLTVYVTEDGLVNTQSGVTGNYTHNHVMRDVISTTYGGDGGVISSGTTGTTYTKTYSYNCDADWVPENVKIIAFVNNWNVDDVNDREIYNAESLHLTDLISSSNDINAQNFMVYPNPANDVLNVNFAEGANIQIVNNLGQVVFSIENAQEYNRIDVSAFEAGSYFVKITKDNSVTNHKVVLVK